MPLKDVRNVQWHVKKMQDDVFQGAVCIQRTVWAYRGQVVFGVFRRGVKSRRSSFRSLARERHAYAFTDPRLKFRRFAVSSME